MNFELLSNTGKAGCIALVASLSLAGCDEQITLAPGAVNAADTCSKFRADVEASRRSDLQKQANAAIAGALIGAVLGAAVAGSDNRAQGALIGASLGGLAGYSEVYYKQVAQRSADANSLLGNVNADAGKERALLTRTGTAAKNLRNCRSSQLASLRSRAVSGKVTKTAARSELNQIKVWVAQDNRLISAAFNGVGQRLDAFVDVTGSVARTQQGINSAGARAKTPNVARLSSERSQQITVSTRSESKVNAEIEALQVLLG
ncbi:glycine zipper 2TM domain-containing protein [Pseudooceanicola sp. 216_PA32_1]|uniref:Glycine zipper 2TM domain-containing protein n=1 Tax=Pseudooceanicola pacificus TaxID=2676438 RepID=A0A844WDV2_9RHOB|nr:YMGG-like glycine zipper-containing protein [Pseudooceanicola pacificus]MWB77049.1 glycine zipper 2TM domain-containing protein [Pseudooceanicola pacificus]